MYSGHDLIFSALPRTTLEQPCSLHKKCPFFAYDPCTAQAHPRWPKKGPVGGRPIAAQKLVRSFASSTMDKWLFRSIWKLLNLFRFTTLMARSRPSPGPSPIQRPRRTSLKVPWRQEKATDPSCEWDWDWRLEMIGVSGAGNTSCLQFSS